MHLNPSPSGTPQPLPDLSRLQRLASLDLSENLFLRVPPGLGRLQALEDLSFRDNSRLAVRRCGCHAGSQGWVEASAQWACREQEESLCSGRHCTECACICLSWVSVIPGIWRTRPH